jgi:hypothetical protein
LWQHQTLVMSRRAPRHLRIGLGLGLWFGAAGLGPGAAGLGGQALAAAALPAGQVLSDVALSDLDDRPVLLGSFAGRTVALLHEDRDTKDGENQALKDALGRATERHGGRFHLIAVADVTPYDFWPAKRFAKDALRKVAGQGVQLLADWKGALRRRLGLRGAGQSTLIVVGPDGRVALVSRGAHAPREVEATIARIDQIVQGGQGAQGGQPAPRPTP